MKPQKHPSITYSSLEYQGASASGHFKPENGEMTWNQGQDQTSRTRARKPLHRLGRTSLQTLFLGSLVLPLIFTFLAFLWVDSIKLTVDQDPGKAWVNKLSTEWTTRLVTVSTAVMRTAVDFQATLATAMIAAIMLERIGIPLHKAPFYSMIRAVDVAPSNLLLATKLRFKRVKLDTFLIYTIITVEVLVTIASQFLSTILLSDFTNAAVPSPVNITMVPILAPEGPDLRSLWLLSPSTSWTFAEESSGPLVMKANFHDTGHTYRTLLPLEDDDERPKLRKFAGPLPIIDHRVTCLSPSLTNLTFDTDNASFVQIRPRLLGTAFVNATSYPMLRIRKGDNEAQGEKFTCALPTGDELDPSKRQLTLCWPRSMNRQDHDDSANRSWNITMEDPLVNMDDYPGKVARSQVILVIDVSNTSALIDSYLSSGPPSFRAAGNDGPWAVLKNNRNDEALRVTTCVTEMSYRTFEAKIQSSWDAREPRVTLRRGSPGGSSGYNTQALRRQLGATLAPDTFSERGILTLEPRSEWTALNETKFNLVNDTRGKSGQDTPWYFADTLTTALPFQLNDSFVFISNTAPGLRVPSEGVMFAHGYHVDVFQDTLNDTKSPALALQAVLTRMTQMMYYDRIGQFDDLRTADTSFATTTFLPVRWKGFVGAMAIIATHLAIVITITILFLKVTEHSHIGGYWQAISQVVTEDTIPILEHRDSMRDKEIKGCAKDGSLPVNIKQHGILRRREDGRVALSLIPSRGLIVR